MRKPLLGVATMALIAAGLAAPAAAAPTVVFSTGNPDGLMAMASRPPSAASIEIEAADDFVLTSAFDLTGATFVGLVPSGASVSQAAVAIYHVFPLDSVNPPSGHVPTRVNSPADSEFASRDSADGNLSYSTTVLSSSFTAANSVFNGINPVPNQTTGGEGPVTGQEVEFHVTFTTPLSLPTGHYFFVPQVRLDTGTFSWLSAPKPIVSPGTPFTPDLQAWMRNANLDPDWLRVGTDIVGPPRAFNGTFSLLGEVLPPVVLSPAHLWIGLKNGDDQGTRFDLAVELWKNGTPVASGLERCITGVTRNPAKATEALVPLDTFGDVFFTSGDELALKVSTGIGTNPDNTKCAGHNTAAGLRLYYDSTSRQSRFDMTIAPAGSTNEYLHSDGNPCANAESTFVGTRSLDPSAPTDAIAKCKDSGSVKVNGGPSVIGTWSMRVP